MEPVTRAFLLMEEGICLLQSDASAALACFDSARELRKGLPAAIPQHAYDLAACWLNRAEALTKMGPPQYALALRAYDEALALLRPLPVSENAWFSRRLAIAYQNRALVLAAQDPLAVGEAIAALLDAMAVLDQGAAMDALERDSLRAVVWVNLANTYAFANTAELDLSAREAARRALALVQAFEQECTAAADAGLKARHVLCQIAARRLSGQAAGEQMMAGVHEATDLADEGLHLVRAWERRGVDRFRGLGADLFRFGALVYACYQPHFLLEFFNEQLNPEQSSRCYVESREMQEAAQEIALRLPTPS